MVGGSSTGGPGGAGIAGAPLTSGGNGFPDDSGDRLAMRAATAAKTKRPLTMERFDFMSGYGSIETTKGALARWEFDLSFPLGNRCGQSLRKNVNRIAHAPLPVVDLKRMFWNSARQEPR